MNDPMKVSLDFSAQIRRELDLREMTQAELNELCGYKSDGLSQVLTVNQGRSPITFRTACRVANGLGMKLVLKLEDECA